jgi:hypothetical protein
VLVPWFPRIERNMHSRMGSRIKKKSGAVVTIELPGAAALMAGAFRLLPGDAASCSIHGRRLTQEANSLIIKKAADLPGKCHSRDAAPKPKLTVSITLFPMAALRMCRSFTLVP